MVLYARLNIHTYYLVNRMFEQRNQKALESISQIQMIFQVRGGHFVMKNKVTKSKLGSLK